MSTNITLSDKQLRSLVGDQYPWNLGASAVYQFSQEISALADGVGNTTVSVYLQVLSERMDTIAQIVAEHDRSKKEADGDAGDTNETESAEAKTEDEAPFDDENGTRARPGTIMECDRVDLEQYAEFLTETLTPEILGDMHGEFGAVLERALQRARSVPVDCADGLVIGSTWRQGDKQ